MVKKDARRVSIKKARNGEYHFVVYAANNEPVMDGETYPEQGQAIEAAVREFSGSSDYDYTLEYFQDGELQRTALGEKGK